MDTPMNRAGRRRYEKAQGRRVWVFSELNHDLRPEQIAKILVTTALDQARKDATAREEHQDLGSATDTSDEGNDV